MVDSRSIPTGAERAVSGTELDFTDTRPIGTSRLDTAFCDLQREADGRARASLSDPASGRGVDLWVDDRYRYLMCYTGDTIEDERLRRTAVAIEPMTCPPDALRSGRDLVVLEPGDSWDACWGLTPF